MTDRTELTVCRPPGPAGVDARLVGACMAIFAEPVPECRRCGIPFAPSPRRRGRPPVYCSRACGRRRMHERRSPPRPCGVCGATVQGRKYCTGECARIAHARRIRENRSRPETKRLLAAAVVRRRREVWRACRARQLGRCGLCRGHLPEAYDGRTCHIDHVLPVALGGDNRPSNLQAVHAACNLAKGASLLPGGLRLVRRWQR